MSGAIPPLPQYPFMAWCSVKAQGQLYLYLYVQCITYYVLYRAATALYSMFSSFVYVFALLCGDWLAASFRNINIELFLCSAGH
jgi:hypothetical protein